MLDLQSLLASGEPKGIAPYITRLHEGRRYHYGTTAEVVGGYVQRASGLWVPSGAKTESSPLDLLRTYMSAKLIIGICPDSVPEERRTRAYLPMLLLVLADNLSVKANPHGEGNISLLGELSLELSANHTFNATVEPDFIMALFQRRWIEMPSENPSRYSTKELTATYMEASGVNLIDQATATVGIFANCVQGVDVTNASTAFSALGWDGEKVRAILSNIALPIEEYRRAIRQELENHSLDWYFTTFARYPLVQFGDDLVLLDPSLLLSRCLGYLPFFDVKESLQRSHKRKDLETFQRAFNDYSERVAFEAFDSMAGGDRARVFDEAALKRAFPGVKTADFVVDYGDAWVVVEVTTSQVSRDTVNAASVSGLERDRDMVVNEAKQVAATIAQPRSDPGKLVTTQDLRRRFYPVVVITDGFPNNPLMQTLVRDHLKAEGCMQSPDVAPLELLTLRDIDIVEGAIENSGTSFTQILELKARSNFWADSARNFVIGDNRFEIRRPARVEAALDRFFGLVATRFGKTFVRPDVQRD